MSDWGTAFPNHLGFVLSKVEEIENHDNDVYKVRIELDNGYWRVDIEYTDWELDQHKLTWMIDHNGQPFEFAGRTS